MSETPRTDLFEKARRGAPASWAEHDYLEALELARHLERELNRVIESHKTLMKIADEREQAAWEAYRRERRLKLAAYQDHQTEKRTFSDFIRNATPEEKEAVYAEVLKRASARQNAAPQAEMAGARNHSVASDQPAVAAPEDLRKQLHRILYECEVKGALDHRHISVPREWYEEARRACPCK